MKHRISAFVTVGVAGFLIQIASLALMTTVAGWPYEPATAVAVQLAVLHNFIWHVMYLLFNLFSQDAPWRSLPANLSRSR